MATAQEEAEDTDRVYVDLVRPAGDAGGGSGTAASVTFRRTKGRDSLKRLSDILSAYIPLRAAPHDHQQPLLEETRDEADAASGRSPPLSPGLHSPGGSRVAYRTLMLLDVAGLRLNEFSSRENLLRDFDAAAAASETAVDGDISGVALSKSGYAFLTFKDSPNILRLEISPRQPDTPVSKTCRLMQVKLRGGVCLVPTDIKVHEERLYACGHLKRQVEDGPDVALTVMVRCDLECRVELASKELPQPRFLGFDVDPADGQLVVASPTPDGKAAQIFKMSSDFRRKLFKIQLGSRSNSRNKPEFVACLTGGDGGCGQCWVAAEQSDSQAGLASGQVKHRLLAFPLRPPLPQAQAQAAEEAEPTVAATIKAWMKVSSWKFEGIKPGRLLAVPGDQEDRLLMLSRDQGNIYWVSQKLGCTALTHPTSEGGQAFTDICCLQEPWGQRSGDAAAVNLLAATKDSLYLLQAS